MPPPPATARRRPRSFRPSMTSYVFGGLSVDEASTTLGISRAVAYRNWKYARAWLREALGE